jgi:hypothetical protein
MRSKSAQAAREKSPQSSYSMFKAVLAGVVYWNPIPPQEIQDTIIKSRQVHEESQILIKQLDQSLADTVQAVERLQKF